ncbi:helix-turn-helix domain-containing protein [Gemmata sp. G18]|uniref:Helix-turn-helix domain-containing protein n=1 Tax=Gemmata palustris TaxID=2822762 RepID=A0ABS5BJ59_9BACT|nr:helix-turn-helix transcriptional regulator [Gemmata palustris]MBP3953729.1 helix-turn-helix domain-containing protein [Gemmata palustris]
MPIRPSKNVVQKMIEFPPDQVAEVEKFAASRGESFKSVVLHALRRHLKYPPPPPDPAPTEPLPPEKQGSHAGYVLQEYRSEHNLSVAQVAESLGLTSEQVEALEAGREATVGEAVLIAHGIGDPFTFLSSPERDQWSKAKAARETAVKESRKRKK